ncbi:MULTISPECIES: hypothetical protein [unclassified Enterococcus]|uniref:hypothetical protein n=1 Tax=unclassified Enterococcus TaxID=2608891 RepID=UPI0015541029|nr:MULTISPECIES: hypothetical protein [unclassified Enterococcus]MBS7576201.1 hypothetical protein [Enterococcus sp. MMGLQ5-2]MBS7583434.1 hypothetical protein [Enterococcus sp. MMGLQ5-1]NPD11294.1 hypothetical protein [Enterococcus sp. MMGLQ5-1]NPD36037.1 hypothetical protein [Enterococcus sp. MMGLQ5-2]
MIVEKGEVSNLEETVISGRSRKHRREAHTNNKILPPFFTSFSLLIVSMILSLTLFASPLTRQLPTSEASFARFAAMMMNKGGVPYLDFVTDKGIIYLLINQLGNIQIFNVSLSLFIQIFIYFFVGLLINASIQRVVKHDKISLIITIFSMLTLARLTLGGETAALYAMPFLTLAFYLMFNRIMNYEHTSDEAMILFGLSGAMLAFIDASQLVLWLLLAVTWLIVSISGKSFKQFVYQLLCLIFGALLIIFPIIIFTSVSGNLNGMLQSTFSNRLLNLFSTNQSSLLDNVISGGFILLVYGLLISVMPLLISLFKPTNQRSLHFFLFIYNAVGLAIYLFSTTNQLNILAAVIPSLAISTALWLRTLISWRILPQLSIQKISVLGVLLLFIIGNIFLPIVGLVNYGNNTYRLMQTSKKDQQAELIADYIADNSKTQALIYVWEADSNIYYLANRRPAANYTLQSTIDFNNYRNRNTKIVSQIKDSQPKYFVIPTNIVKNGEQLKGWSKTLYQYVTDNYQWVTIDRVSKDSYYVGELKESAAAESTEEGVEESMTVPDESVTESSSEEGQTATDSTEAVVADSTTTDTVEEGY